MPGKTTNYQLNQYGPEDICLRTDVNGDNAIIDQALQNKAEAEDLAGLFVWGSYTGQGSYGNRNISLGFRPRLLLTASLYGAMYASSSNYGGIAMDGFPMCNASRTPVMTITDDGFLLHYAEGGALDINNLPYYYIAIR